MIITACINEIFSSPQGEGAHIGEWMTFIRFANCGLGCQWCDTDYSPHHFCDVFDPNSKSLARTIKNPVGISELIEIIDNFSDKTVAVTGGEPLEQADFLENLLPHLSHKRKILLETNGIYYERLKRVVQSIDIISMDIKLPSSTGRRPFWKEHERFLDAALESQSEIYIKLVVTPTTSDKDINDAIKLIYSRNRHIPLFIQPVSPTDGFTERVSEDRLHSMKRLFSAWLPNVKITPQMHKIWDVK